MLRRYVDELCHKRNLGALEKIMSADYFVDHADKELRGPDGLKRLHEAHREAFPDAADVTVEDRLPPS